MATLAPCCTTGTPGSKIHNSAGMMTKVGSMETYVSSPTSSLRGGLLLLPDGFGQCMHNYILADLFAAEGWKVFLPDYFEGNPLPEAFLRRDPSKSIDEQVGWSEEDREKIRHLDLGKWTKDHPLEKIERLLAGFIPAVKLQLPSPNLPLVGVGYCFGGKYALRLASSSTIDAAAVFHPSLVDIDEDTNGISVPVLVGAAENDQAVPLDFCRELKKIIDKGSGPVELEIYEGMKHGFGARPNTADPAVKKQFLKAFNDANAFFDKYLRAT